MDIKLLLSIYNKPWLIEPGAASQMLDIWSQIQDGKISSLHDVNDKKEGPVFGAADKVTVAPVTNWGRSQFKGFNSPVAIIPVTGPLMKSDYCGDLGTASMQDLARQAAVSPAVETIVFMMDTPGGTVDGTQSFASTIAGINKKTIALVDGMMASAGYWIGSHCNEVYAANGTNFIGSIGTMCSLYDDESYMEKKGIVLREYYASASSDKNTAMKEAVRGDGKKLIQEILDPLNNEFLSAVKQVRPNIAQEALTGKLYTAKTAQELGLIDGIKSLDEILTTTKTKNSTNSKSKIMTAEQLRMEHPAVHAEIMKAGATAERQRVNAFNEWRETDPEAVDKYIADGTEMSANIISAFSAKAMNKIKAEAVKKDNAEDLDLPESKMTSEDEMEISAIEAELKRMSADRN